MLTNKSGNSLEQHKFVEEFDQLNQRLKHSEEYDVEYEVGNKELNKLLFYFSYCSYFSYC